MSTADAGAFGALAVQLEKAFRIGNTLFGLLLTVSSLVGAVATLPMGVLADRRSRVRILVVAIAVWSVAMVAAALSVDYMMLLLTRIALGGVIAAAGPAVASLTGDLFPAGERSRVYGFVLTGELLGSGVGLLIAGNVGAATSWRVALLVLTVPGAALAVALHRLLPEPARGGQSRLPRGAEAVPAAGGEARTSGQAGAERGAGGGQGAAGAERGATTRLRRRARRERGVEPDDRLVLDADPRRMGPWAAARYVLRVPSNRVLIASSALGYFFLAGLRAFAVIFARGHFGLSQGVVSSLLVFIGAGAIAGTLAGGRLTDRLIGRGRLDARMVVAGCGLAAAAVLFVPGLVLTDVLVAVPVLIAAAGFLAAPNAAIDAARLDVVPSSIWGRAEAIRTFVRSSLEAAAPLLFGYVSELFGGAKASIGAGVNASHRPTSPAATHGLELAFLVMLAPLAAGGVLLVWHRRTYLRDVVTAGESEERSPAGAGR